MRTFALLLLGLLVIAKGDAAEPWPHVTADNGTKFAIYPPSIGSPSAGIVGATVCQIDVDGHHCVGDVAWAMSARHFWFNCRGRYADITHGAGGGWQVVPPSSVIRGLSDLACERANNRPK